MHHHARFCALLALAIASSGSLAQDVVEYQTQLATEWSEQTHPQDFPSNAHFSRLIGATHNQQASLWIPGGIASPGIELMAETGGSTLLQGEVNALISAGSADQFLSLGSVPNTPGFATRTLTAQAQFPLLSIVTMIAPSPDWFIGVHDVDLRPNGVWVRELLIDLHPYDAGTDAGVSYGSANSDITPHIPIEIMTSTFPFEGTGRIGTLRITLLSDAACSLADLALPYETLDFFDVSAFISAYTSQDQAADLNNDGDLNFFDVSAFLDAFNSGCP